MAHGTVWTMRGFIDAMAQVSTHTCKRTFAGKARKSSNIVQTLMTAQEYDLLKNHERIHKDYVLPTQYVGSIFRHVINQYGFRAPLPLNSLQQASGGCILLCVCY